MALYYCTCIVVYIQQQHARVSSACGFVLNKQNKSRGTDGRYSYTRAGQSRGEKEHFTYEMQRHRHETGGGWLAWSGDE